MGADQHPDRPGVVQIAIYSLGALVYLAALAGLYEVGQHFHQPLLLPAALGLSVLYGIVRYSRKWVGPIWAARRERAGRLHNYPLLVEELRTLKDEKRQLEQRAKALELDLGRRFRAGLREGYGRVLGHFLSDAVTTLPTIVAVGKTGEKVRLTCRRNGDNPVRLGTRFLLITDGAGEPCGGLVVTDLLNDGQTLTLDVLEEMMPEFWTKLRERAGYDFKPPAGVGLAQYPIPQIPEEKQVGDEEQLLK